MRVYRGVANIPLSSQTVTVTLPTPVPVGKSFPIVSSRIGQNLGSVMNAFFTATLGGEVDGNYTTLQLQRGNSDLYAATVAWQVVTSDVFNVQMVTAEFSYNSVLKEVDINYIDTSKTFVLLTCRGPSVDISILNRQFFTRASLTSSQIQLQVGSSGGSITCVAYVVEMSGAEVQPITVQSNGTISVDISAVDLEKTFLIYTFTHLDSYDDAGRLVVGRITSTTKVQFSSSSGEFQANAFVVSHNDIKVSTGAALLDEETTKSFPVEVDNTRAFSLLPFSRSLSGGSVDRALVTHVLADTSLTLQRDFAGVEIDGEWQAVEWPVPPPAQNLYPNNTAIMPNEANVFTWEIPEGEQIKHEIERRKTGGIWQSMGIVQGVAPAQSMPPGMFDAGKVYEWRVKYWMEGKDDPSELAVAVFDTINPTIQNIVPTPDSKVKTGIANFSALLKSPLGYDVQLTIEIADEPDFLDPATYNLSPVHSGQAAAMQHAIRQGGVWYVRLTATDVASNQTVLVYSFSAEHFMRFLSYPDITLQGPQATHVTVHSRDTLAEYTAVVDPAPLPDKRIERLVYIDSGNQNVCQAVATELIDKWGREQISVKGTVPLTLVLRPDQKVRVVIPDIGLDEGMILQRKYHDVVPGSETHVELGDIMLSEQELVARIIDDLGAQSANVSTLTGDLMLLGQELSECEIVEIEQGQELSDT